VSFDMIFSTGPPRKGFNILDGLNLHIE